MHDARRFANRDCDDDESLVGGRLEESEDHSAQRTARKDRLVD